MQWEIFTINLTTHRILNKMCLAISPQGCFSCLPSRPLDLSFGFVSYCFLCCKQRYQRAVLREYPPSPHSARPCTCYIMDWRTSLYFLVCFIFLILTPSGCIISTSHSLDAFWKKPTLYLMCGTLVRLWWLLLWGCTLILVPTSSPPQLSHIILSICAT